MKPTVRINGQGTGRKQQLFPLENERIREAERLLEKWPNQRIDEQEIQKGG